MWNNTVDTLRVSYVRERIKLWCSDISQFWAVFSPRMSSPSLIRMSGLLRNVHVSSVIRTLPHKHTSLYSCVSLWLFNLLTFLFSITLPTYFKTTSELRVACTLEETILDELNDSSCCWCLQYCWSDVLKKTQFGTAFTQQNQPDSSFNKSFVSEM